MMTLTAIIASVFLDRIVDVGRSLRSWDFISDWAGRGLERVQGNHLLRLLLVLLVMLVPAMVVGWIDEWVGGLAAPLVLIWSTAVLFVCFGPLPLEAEVGAYLQSAERCDEEALNDRAGRLAYEDFSDSTTPHGVVVRSILAQVNTQIVAMIFWFIVLGPLAAVLYRITLQLIDKSTESVQADEQLTHCLLAFMGILTWLPARMLIFAYALAGRFEGTLGGLSDKRTDKACISLLHDNNTALSTAGLSALALTPEQTLGIDDINAARQLVFRAVAICAVLVGFITLSIR